MEVLKNLIISNYRYIWYKLHVSVYFCFLLSCIMHVFIMHALSYRFSHVINKSIYIKQSKIFTLSLQQQPRTALHAPLEENRSLKLLKENCNRPTNIKNIICPKQQKIVNNAKDILNSNKNLPIAEKNNLNTSEVINNSISSFEINHHQGYVPSCVINRIYPEYPNRAKILGIEGVVTVQYNVNIDGKTDSIRILSAVPAGIFEASIRSAMRRWVYEHNKPEKDLIITFKFCLNSSKNFD